MYTLPTRADVRKAQISPSIPQGGRIVLVGFFKGRDTDFIVIDLQGIMQSK